MNQSQNECNRKALYFFFDPRDGITSAICHHSPLPLWLVTPCVLGMGNLIRERIIASGLFTTRLVLYGTTHAFLLNTSTTVNRYLYPLL